ncbi:MAG: sulfatase-like hydrolase/transferase [Tannerellaceae bacterium]|jgi:phosphoglycerol transferase MdoB-like AlkP superfamily enzyme|nr:sulfatase-like hydrolase/transferase [Tannerellaceae bacterium]
MKQRLFFLLLVFIGWLAVLAVQKPLFMFYHYNLAEGCTALEWLKVIRYGLRLDCTIAGYLTIVPLLGVILSIWMPGTCVRKALRVYFGIAATLVAMVFAADVALYTFWGFRLDATVLFYIQFPSGAAGSVPAGLLIKQIILVVVYAFAAIGMFNALIVPLMPDTPPVRKKTFASLAFLVAGGTLFLPVWGIVTTSTANIGMVYFSNKQFLNHSAVNPVFSLTASLFKQQDFASQFQFFPEEKRRKLFHNLLPSLPADSVYRPEVELLCTQRPDILLVILESFSANAVGATGGVKDVTPALNRLSREGVLFTNMYANSFRTDRGLVSVLNGYPAQPTTSIMKYPAKSRNLPSLAGSLIREGYTAEMLYGGDIDYTNMRSYFYSSGYGRITSRANFPRGERLSKWGANDDVTFRHLFRLLQEKGDTSAHLFSTFLTLSSHEPFEVPCRRFTHPYLNSVAFTDSCIGDFIDRVKKTPAWENLLIIFIADHGFRYPEHLKEYEPARYHIPMLWLGGAVKQPLQIETILSQTDLAATLFGQLDIPHQEFLFSKDIFNGHYPPFAFYTFSNGFGYIDPSGVSVYDNDGNRSFFHHPKEEGPTRIEYGKAILQTLYDDLGHR